MFFLSDFLSYLINDSRHEESDLHEEEVGGGVKKCQVGERQVVVEAVEPRGDHVVGQDPRVLRHLPEQGGHGVAGKKG